MDIPPENMIFNYNLVDFTQPVNTRNYKRSFSCPKAVLLFWYENSLCSMQQYEHLPLETLFLRFLPYTAERESRDDFELNTRFFRCSAKPKISQGTNKFFDCPLSAPLLFRRMPNPEDANAGKKRARGKD